MRHLNVIRKNKENTIDYILGKVHKSGEKVLNIGSGFKRFGYNCINLDIQNNPGVDLIADAHDLPFSFESFNICILSAVLQYCRNPFRVAEEVHRILVPGGLVIIDAPFVQPYWFASPDLFRFSKDGLTTIFGKYFEIIKCDVSIPGGSALASYLQGIASVLFTNKYFKYLFVNMVSFIVYPLSFIKMQGRHEIAGAFILLGKKSESL